MAEFKYRHKGTANEKWNEDVIEAEDAEEAQAKLKELYGAEAIANGTVQVELVN